MVAPPTRIALAALAALLALPATGARAQDADRPRNQYLLEAERRAKAGEYIRCIEELDSAARVPMNPAPIRRDIAGIRGVCLTLQKPPQTAAAEKAFVEARRIDPDWAPPPWVPDKAVAAYERSRHAKKVLLVHVPLIRVPGARPVVVSAHVVDPGHQVAQIYAAYRLSPTQPYTEVPLKPALGGTLTAFLTVPDPGDDPVGFEVDYYVAAVDASGKILDSSGTADAPNVFQVVPASRLHATDIPPPPPKPPPKVIPPPPWYKHWWVWAIAGAVVVGAGAGTFAATRPGPPPTGSLGSLQLPEVRR